MNVLKIFVFTLLVSGIVGLIIGISLAYIARQFYMKIDPHVAAILDCLAKTHCGACGYAGCEQYAEALAHDHTVSIDLCLPGGQKAIEQLAQITGKEATITKVKPVAQLLCKGTKECSITRMSIPELSCAQAATHTSPHGACEYGCLGSGDCQKACPFGAITMSPDGLPHVSEAACAGCGKCVKACPRNLFIALPREYHLLVACASNNPGAVTRKSCQAGCIACGKCVKACPVDAIHVEDFLASINQVICIQCGACRKACPVGVIEEFVVT